MRVFILGLGSYLSIYLGQYLGYATLSKYLGYAS